MFVELRDASQDGTPPMLINVFDIQCVMTDEEHKEASVIYLRDEVEPMVCEDSVAVVKLAIQKTLQDWYLLLASGHPYLLPKQ